ncbi:MAG: DUF2723 domain-containing protein [Thermodesulfobacteriota bacterium]|nr:DUF2723 domain-containing protein [Thermodesulfobacteriota bacterium]
MKERRNMKRNSLTWFFFVIPLFVFYIYLITLCPQIFWRDAPEFVATVQTLSISHPAGSPTYNLFAKAFTFLPIANVPFRVHMASALCGAAVLFVMLLIMKEIFEILYKRPPALLDLVGMSFCAFLFGISFSFWKFSITAEVYPLQDFFILIVLYLGIRFYRSGDIRLFFSGALLFGLGLGAHMVNGLFFFPFLILYLSRKNSWKHIGVIVFFFLLGFSVYLYLPFRFERAQLVLGYNTNNLEQTISHMAARNVMEVVKEGIINNSMRMELFYIKISEFFKNIIEQLSFLGFVLGVFGFFVLLVRRFFISFITTTMFVLYWWFFINWTNPFGFFPNYIIWMIWSAIGISEIITIRERMICQKTS